MDGRNMNDGAASAAPYELKPLSAPDVFQLVRILGKIGLADCAASIDKKTVEEARFTAPQKLVNGRRAPVPEDEWTEGQKRAYQRSIIAQSQLTMQIIDLALRHLPDCEAEIYTLLAGAVGKDAAEIRSMGAVDFLQLLTGYIDREEFPDFFTQAVKLLSGTRRNIDSLI